MNTFLFTGITAFTKQNTVYSDSNIFDSCESQIVMKISFYRHLSTIASKPCLKTCSNLRLVEEVISEAQEATISRFLASILSRKRYEGTL